LSGARRGGEKRLLLGAAAAESSGGSSFHLSAAVGVTGLRESVVSAFIGSNNLGRARIDDAAYFGVVGAGGGGGVGVADTPPGEGVAGEANLGCVGLALVGMGRTTWGVG
jgi:hypothetical protein